MIKARGRVNDSDTLFLGLTFADLDELRSKPLDDFIWIKGAEIGSPFDIMITAGRTDADVVEAVQAGIGPDTKVTISQKVKN